ncbi:hypothetical protein [Cellulosimicrobium sp. NPDC057862]|uniref:hypothetical protein n=1 Tax=Cellulosimicrobium sp. NPDC057862 TaxID=3346266 RepID=UPI003671E6BC
MTAAARARAALARWNAVGARRRATRTGALGHADLLARGVFVSTSEGVWHRFGTPLPHHLRRSRRHLDVVGAEPSRHPLRDALLLAARRLPPPWAFLSHGPSGPYTVVTTTFEGGMLFLEPGRSVARTVEGGGANERYATLRRRFSEHVRCPSYRFVDDLLVEEFVTGRHPLELDDDALVALVRTLVLDYAHLARAEWEVDSRRIVESALDLVRGAALPDGFPSPSELAAFVARTPEWGTVPSGADPQVNNLVVAPDGTPVPIDLGVMVLAPFFVFPVGMIASAHGAVLAAYLDGGLDEAVGQLFTSARAAFDATRRDRVLVLALWAAVTCWYEARRLTVVDDLARVGALLAEQWDDLGLGAPGTAP